MKNITVTPVYRGKSSKMLFDVVIGWEEAGAVREEFALSDLIFLDKQSLEDPHRRAEVKETALQGFSFLGAVLGRVKEDLAVLELRLERWEAMIRPKVKDYLPGKPTLDDIRAGMLSLNALLAPQCVCGNVATHFVVSDTEVDGSHKQQGKYLVFVCADHLDDFLSTGADVHQVVELGGYVDTPLVPLADGFIYDEPLEKLGYVITGYTSADKYVCLGDIWEAFEMAIRRLKGLVNDRNNSRGALEVILKAFEYAHKYNQDIIDNLSREYRRQAADK